MPHSTANAGQIVHGIVVQGCLMPSGNSENHPSHWEQRAKMRIQIPSVVYVASLGGGGGGMGSES